MCRIRFRPEAPEPETNGTDGKKPKKERKARRAPLLGTNSSSMLAVCCKVGCYGRLLRIGASHTHMLTCVPSFGSLPGDAAAY